MFRRKSKRLPFANHTEKLGGVPYYTNNNKKKTKLNYEILQESQTSKTTVGQWGERKQ